MSDFTEEEIEALRLQDLQRASELRDRPLEEMKEGYCSELGYREVLHLSSVFFAMVETHLLEHPAILFDSKAYKLAFSAFGALHDLYQRIGQLENEAYEAAHLVAS